MSKREFKDLMMAWRVAAGYSQEALAELLAQRAKRNVSSHLVGKIEIGKRDPQDWLVIAFANLSRQDVNALLKAANLPVIEKEALPLA